MGAPDGFQRPESRVRTTSKRKTETGEKTSVFALLLLVTRAVAILAGSKELENLVGPS